MSNRKHIRKPQGEIVATTASPKEKQEKCKKAYQNRKEFKKEYVNVPINITIGNAATTDTLRQLRKLIGPRYFITILSIRKELNAFEAAEYLKKGFKVEIVEE
jgi:hypothetical protein